MSEDSSLPTFHPKARVFPKGHPDFGINAYQYAFSSRNGMSPAAIIYPFEMEDIFKAVDYAKSKNIGVAVRTGGHQYCGYSSTSGSNIQLDMSDIFQDPAKDFAFIPPLNLLRVGTSFALEEMNKMMGAMNMFLPGGICAHVHLGGHVQTGGYGMIGRSHGLLSDYVEGFEIVLADSKDKARLATVWKPGSGIPKPEDLIDGNDELFWAVLGGSPGNFGILTHLYLRPLHDKDFPDSRMMKVMTIYTPEKHLAMEKLMAETTGANDFPGNFDYSIMIMSPRVPSFTGAKYFEHILKQGPLNIDQEMMYKHGEQYGDGVPWNELGQGKYYYLVEKGLMPVDLDFPPYILGYFKWVNLNNEKFGEKERVWFERVREAMGGENEIHDFPTLKAQKEEPTKTHGLFLSNLAKGTKDESTVAYPAVSYLRATPLSEQMQLWPYEEAREFSQSCFKRCYISEKKNLLENGYPEWVASRVAEMMNYAKEHDYSVNFVLQSLSFGGEKSSMFPKLGKDFPNNSCHSWRSEINQAIVLDAFYDPYQKEAYEFAKNWVTENDKMTGGGIFSDHDRRFLWATFSKEDDPDGGVVLDSVWDKYFDSKEKYEKLMEVKKKFDPNFVFTANTFGVRASMCFDEGKRVKITQK